MRKLDERGISLIEVIVSVIMLSTALLSLASAAGLAMRTTARGREDLRSWAAVQRVADSLTARGAGNVASGSGTVQGRALSWTVSGANPERIDLIVDRRRMSDMVIVQDTLVFYLSQ